MLQRILAVSIAAFVVLASQPALAAEEYLGTITSEGASVNQSTTASAFALTPGMDLMVQCDAIAYVRWVAASATAVTSSNGLRLGQHDTFVTKVGSTRLLYLAVISASGTANCKVFRVYQ